MNLKILVSIVLYNKKLTDSVTYNKIVATNYPVEFLIFDNSTSDYKNGAICVENKHKYLSVNENVGLSKAYNKIFEYANDMQFDYIILFDDDSSISDDYFTKLEPHILNGEKIIAPIICDANDNLWGPKEHANISFINYIKSKKVALSIEKIKTMESNNELSAINSGLVISKDVFSVYKYDERLFLDCVDWKFCDDMQKMNIQINYFEGKIIQDFHYDNSDKIITPGIHKRILGRKKDLWNYSKKKYLFYLSIVIFVHIKSTKNIAYLKYYFIKK
jgi:GT2 family glycosyltransferase